MKIIDIVSSSSSCQDQKIHNMNPLAKKENKAESILSNHEARHRPGKHIYRSSVKFVDQLQLQAQWS